MSKEPTESELLVMSERELIALWIRLTRTGQTYLEELKLDVPAPEFNKDRIRAHLDDAIDDLNQLVEELEAARRHERKKRRHG